MKCALFCIDSPSFRHLFASNVDRPWWPNDRTLRPSFHFVNGLRRLEGKGRSAVLTAALGQEVLDELGVVADVQDAVHAGVHQVLLLVAQILADVLGDKHDVSLHVDHEKEAVKGLEERGGHAKMNTGGRGSRGKRPKK